MVERPSNNLISPPIPSAPYSTSAPPTMNSSKLISSPDTLHSHKELPDMPALFADIVCLKDIIEQASNPTSRLQKGPDISAEEALELLKSHKEYLRQLDHWSQACHTQIDKVMPSPPTSWVIFLKKWLTFFR